MKSQRFTMSFIAAILALSPSIGSAEEPASGGVGFYTAVAGKVSVTHSGEARVLPVKLHDEVLFKDVIETEKESRTKAFFQDDSVLTVGENSRVEITEYIYNPEANLRRSVVNLMQGQVRALVSKVFKSNGSRFEVHTPSAVAAARGTYFSVWYENGQSGIINIGGSGRVDFTSGGVTVAVDPGKFSLAEKGKSPSIPALHGLGVKTDMASVQAQVAEKDGKGARLVESHQGEARLVESQGEVLVESQGEMLVGSQGEMLVEGQGEMLVESQGEMNGADPIATLSQASSDSGLARAIQSVGSTMISEAPPVGLPTQTLDATDHAAYLAKAYAQFKSLSVEQKVSTSGNGKGPGSSGPGKFGPGTVVVVSPPAVITGVADVSSSADMTGVADVSSSAGMTGHGPKHGRKPGPGPRPGPGPGHGPGHGPKPIPIP